MATDLVFETIDAPRDDTPDISSETVTGDYDPEFPGSTPEAPYGYLANGEPRKRRPKGSGKGGNKNPVATGSRTPASEKQAATAAALLARMNAMLGLGLMAMGLPMTAASLAEANDQFESMAKEALMTDPALCRKILSAGATSGKTALVFAYGMLGASVAPAAFVEFKERRAEREDES